ncbi:proteasome-associated protein ECM29, partial [Tanacetum coccineum]
MPADKTTPRRKNLVNALLDTLTGSEREKECIKLVDTTENSKRDPVGNSSGGKTWYLQELCNLANEMGQPDLIYKFMDLANHQASLNSKRGAAFGFSKIAKLAGDALQPHLRQLVPRLVRYQYDPDKNVQDAMSHIWKSLVADSKKTIDEYLDLIIEDMLVQCLSRLWRSREASCLALADLIQGRKFDQVGKHLKNIWIEAFRAMDDIKETVRTSGERLCRAVTSLTLRLCDISLTEISDAKKAMDVVLPLLLTDGIMSKVDDIRKASITIVTKLAKGAGIAIRPHLSELVVCMLESLSSLEDQTLNYVERHAENAGIQTEKLENLRISIAKGSPLWETLSLCIEVVDDQSLEQLVPRLSQLARSGVGLNTSQVGRHRRQRGNGSLSFCGNVFSDHGNLSDGSGVLGDNVFHDEFRFHGIRSGQAKLVEASSKDGGLYVRGMAYEVELGKYLAMVFSGLAVLVMIADR